MKPDRGRVPVRLHASVLLAGGLIALLLGTSVLPRQVPGLAGAQYTAAAVLGSLLFLVSVFAHELAHAVVARRNGVAVKQVTLWALGGTTELDGQPATPGAAFRIAGVGPLISALAGVAFLAGAVVTSGLASAVLGWAGMTNLVLTVFNVLPGTPLDGGRLVAAAVWKRTGDPARGTLAAAKAGRVIGLLVLFGGAVQAMLGSVTGGIWLMVIGWFLTTTARLEGNRVSLTGALHGVDTAAVMTPVTAAPGWLTVDAFIERVVEPSRQSMFALAAFDGAPAGVVSLGQLTAVPAAQRSAVRAIAVGTPIDRLGTAAPSDPAEALPGRLGPAGVVLVVTDGAAVGLVTAAELARAAALRPHPRVERLNA
jgi:Zn-dependent protease